ncbi:MAG: response regulator [Elainella sp.]
MPELLQTLETGLLDLQQDHSVAKMHELMRTAHSIKGGAACVGLRQIQTLAHQLETALKTCSETAVVVDLELENLMLQAFDCLRAPLLEEIETGNCDDIATVAARNPIWQELADKLAAQSSTPGPALDLDLPLMPSAALAQAQPAAQPVALASPPAVAAPFLQNLQKGLQRLETILAQPESPSLFAALTAQLEIFKGLGELADWPDWLGLADQTLFSLRINPATASSVGTTALQEFQQLYATLQPASPIAPSSIGSSSAQTDSAQPQPPLEGAGWWRYAAEPTADDSPTHPPVTPLDNLDNRLAAPLPSKAIPRSMGLRQDWARLELLSNLVGELATQDNRFRSQREQQVETLELMGHCFNRVRQLSINLNRWMQQSNSQGSSGAVSGAASARTGLEGDLAFPKRRRYNNQQAHLQMAAQSIAEELSQMGETIQDLMLIDQRLQHLDKQKRKTLKQVQSHLFQAQMLPISELLNQFPRMVRDLAAGEQKQVTLELNGTQTLVDKAILEKLYDPLVHLVRNAFDHGIEPPEVRQVLGKPAQGKITIRAWHRGNQSYLQVQDDGHGIDSEQIRAKISAMGMLSTAEIASMPDQRLYEYLFSPGFSTMTEVSSLSGRGMGLYAVQSQIQALKGVITVDSKPNRGTTFTLRLPLTLTITKLLVFTIQDNLLAIPVEMLEAITVASEQVFQTEQGQQFYHWQGRFVPIYPEVLLLNHRYPRLSESLEEPLEFQTTAESQRRSKQFPLLLLSHGEVIIALKVDQIVLEQDLMIKPFNDAIAPPAGLSGCTILADGRLAPVLDGPALIEKWLKLSQTPADTHLPHSHALPQIPAILVVDDSLTIRHALSTTLSKAGYQVIQAKDGWDALTQLRLRPAIAAVICDIEMPRMNGIEFLSRCQQQGMTRPVLILTYRSGIKYRQLAKQLGAAAYLTKPYLDKELLKTLETCLTAQHPPQSSG